jgi:hypothetical protein
MQADARSAGSRQSHRGKARKATLFAADLRVPTLDRAHTSAADLPGTSAASLNHTVVRANYRETPLARRPRLRSKEEKRRGRTE